MKIEKAWHKNMDESKKEKIYIGSKTNNLYSSPQHDLSGSTPLAPVRGGNAGLPFNSSSGGLVCVN